VIPCRNEAAHIETCLQAVFSQQPPEGGFEVIVADGMSDDGTREILVRLEKEVSGQCPVVSGPILRVIANPGRIVSTGLNAAIQEARGDIIVRMDAHAEYAPDYIQRCVEALHRTGADNVGGPARTKANNLLQEAVAAAYHSPFSVGGARFHNVDYEGWVDTVTYGCWRKAVFVKWGYFDEELVRNQDDEHNLRLIRGGGRIYQSPKIRSWYRPRGSLRALFKQYAQYGYWKVRVIQKHKLPAHWRHLVPGAFVLALVLLFVLSAFCFLFSTLTSDLWPLSSAVLLFALGTYLIAVLIASIVAAAKSAWRLLPILPLVFPCYHFGYGIGFLRGIWDFVIRKKGAHKNFEALTR
jgi:glycosyltransferase involved in cell wall biosynthesis